MTVPALTSIQNADIPKTKGAQRQSPNAAPANFADQLSISLGQHGKFGEIVQQYNFNKISHDEIQQLGKKLRDAGAITDEQFLEDRKSVV